jgi:dTDP-4-amino-4,6-dideoxygalactose transaminase
MAIEELKRVDAAVQETRNLAKELKGLINNRKDIWYYPQREDCEHSYYCLPVGCFGDVISSRLSDLGIDHYMEPLTELPAFQYNFAMNVPTAYEISRVVRVIELVRNPRMDEIKKALESM